VHSARYSPGDGGATTAKCSAFSQAEIPALIPQLVHDEAVYIVLSGFLDSVGVCMDENLLQSGYIIC
jgi:hypothetical protein